MEQSPPLGVITVGGHDNENPPRPSPHDGKVCTRDFSPNFAALPIAYADYPLIASYPLVGYGAINERSLSAALSVLHGDKPMPERPLEDAASNLDQEVRSVLSGR